ncbi:MAG: endonuclease MutS2 [Armatimonadetes bacterium]|nr:endonuclease MutS2 [Armatimonadota bacterium]
MRSPADERTLRVLEFPKIIAALAERTVTPMGKTRAFALLPADDPDLVREALEVTTEAVALSAEGEIPVRGARDLEPLAARAAAGGGLEAADLLEVAQTLEVTRRLHAFLRARAGRAPRLAERAARLHPLPEIEAEIGRALDDQGRIKDDASPALRRIRDEQREVERRLRSSLDALVHDSALARLLQEPLVTTRGDRFVVPVKAEHRGQFPGIVHDTSASGATLFMEPLALVPLGNRRRELEAAEREEILRILRRLSGLIGAHAAALRDSGAAIGEIDLAAAKAALAARLRATAPAVGTDGIVGLRGARHPLLVLTRGEDAVVPIDADLGGEFTTLVVTGPNTGGKTVALKTIGLLALMAQAGLHILADDGSRVPIFSQVHADVGDEQSIEQNLSTFSSHMGAIVEILRVAAPPALVLLDEVGAGTDPTEGVALARAIIQTLHRRGVHTVVTTHYNELKMLASVVPGVENASVEFDTDTLQPTYRLRIGLPGRSNALIIAERLGLDPSVVTEARGHLAPEQVAIERVLEDLTHDRQAAERDLAEAARAREAAEEAEHRWRAEADRLRAERRRLLSEARRAAEAIIDEARRRLDEIMAEVRAGKSEAAVRQARERFREVLEALPVVEPPPSPGVPVEAVAAGQAVFVAPLGRVGIVRGAPDAHDEVEVEVGAVRTRVPRSALRRAEAAVPAPADRIEVPQSPTVPASINVRGQTVDDALVRVDHYLDEAVRAHLPQVTVIHGKGTGRLRKALHDFLRGHPHVKQFRIGERGEGDEGATVVTLNL